MCDCLDRFNGILKKVGIYETIWASRYKQQLVSPYTNTILTCYGELVISSWDVYQTTGLGEMYDEFFHQKNHFGQKAPRILLRVVLHLVALVYGDASA